MQIKRKRLDPPPDSGFAYGDIYAGWWRERARDRAHARAYRNIAGFIRASLPREPGLVVDYACGAGQLLARLAPLFPHSRLVGLDGSDTLLDLAAARLARLPDARTAEVTLTRTHLPMDRPFGEKADLAVYTFPNMMPSLSAEEAPGAGLDREEREIARRLARDPGGESDPALLEYGRSISRDLRRLLVRGGLCVRAEYADSRREEWEPQVLQQVAFEEGSLDQPIDGLRPRTWFRVLASAFFRSRVMEDVYEQTGEDRDRSGGYLITVLGAL
jgi:SAM-dependent methyltransferase